MTRVIAMTFLACVASGPIVALAQSRPATTQASPAKLAKQGFLAMSATALDDKMAAADKLKRDIAEEQSRIEAMRAQLLSGDEYRAVQRELDEKSGALESARSSGSMEERLAAGTAYSASRKKRDAVRDSLLLNDAGLVEENRVLRKMESDLAAAKAAASKAGENSEKRKKLAEMIDGLSSKYITTTYNKFTDVTTIKLDMADDRYRPTVLSAEAKFMGNATSILKSPPTYLVSHRGRSVMGSPDVSLVWLLDGKRMPTKVLDVVDDGHYEVAAVEITRSQLLRILDADDVSAGIGDTELSLDLGDMICLRLFAQKLGYLKSPTTTVSLPPHP